MSQLGSAAAVMNGSGIAWRPGTHICGSPSSTANPTTITSVVDSAEYRHAPATSRLTLERVSMSQNKIDMADHDVDAPGCRSPRHERYRAASCPFQEIRQIVVKLFLERAGLHRLADGGGLRLLLFGRGRCRRLLGRGLGRGRGRDWLGLVLDLQGARTATTKIAPFENRELRPLFLAEAGLHGARVEPHDRHDVVAAESRHP